MTEKDFWVKYFESQFFNRDRPVKYTPNSGDEIFAKYAVEADKDKGSV